MAYSPRETPDYVQLEPTAPANAAVIWLHGLGANGYDFASVPPELNLPSTLSVRFIFPHARQRPVTVNNGIVMPAWYDIQVLGGGLGVEDDAGIRESAGVIGGYIEREMAAGIASKRIVVIGFSQGGAVALHTGLRYPQRLAGVAALSSYLPLRNSLAAEAAPANRDVPVLMCHGVYDPVVPAAMGVASRNLLQQLGYAVEWHTYPMQHSVCMEEIADISRWLQVSIGP
ncbi:MAG TPA: alpha/beta hydrolase-fold protein [Povalibacter sp.]|nr:alpha/beta hydrolase-fold protein [Povalibacter sp.]